MTHVNFVSALPGLSERSFDLTGVTDSPGLFKLAGATSPTRMFVVDPVRYAPAYAPSIRTEDLERIGVEGGQPLVLLVANPSASSVAVNLAAPILINPDTGAGVQVILEDPSLPLNADLAGLAG